MGGTSKQTQTTQSQTQPWEPAQSTLTGILGGLGNINTSLTPTQTGAINTLESNAANGNPFTGDISSLASNLFNGGGATAQAPLINSAYQTYANNLLPLTNPATLDPRNTPGFSDALAATNNDITNQISGMYAGAGRDPAGAGSFAQTLGRGLSQGEGQLISNQYNQNVGNYLNATNALFGAGQGTAGLLTGLNQQALTNQQAGVGAAGSFLDALNYGPNATLAAEAQKTGIPLSILSGIAGIATPIAGLGRDTTGTATTTQAANPLQAIIGGGIAGLGLLGGSNPFTSGLFKLTQSNPNTWIPAPYG